MSRVSECGRCGSKIVESNHRIPETNQFIRQSGPRDVESGDVKLCTMCLDDIWEFVFDEDVDRSDKADPIPLKRVSENVERHIQDLEGILDSINGAISD